MKADPFFTVIMPVYNVEQYLERAIESVLQQTFTCIQLILVNDASTDQSGKICEKYSKMDERVQVIQKPFNEGLSYARNTGIPYAKGQYVLFMDSDDYIDTDLFFRAYNELQSNPAKVVLWGVIEEYYNDKGEISYSKEITYSYLSVKTQKEVRENIINLEEKTLYGYAWNKLYRLDYLKKYQFLYKKLTMIEDLEFNVRYFEDIDSMIVIDKAAYHYCNRNNGSLTRKFLPDYFAIHSERIRLLLEQQERWGICDETIKCKLGVRYCRYFLSALQRNCDPRGKLRYKNRKNWVREQYSSELYTKLIDSTVSDNKMLNITICLIKNKRTISLLMLGRLMHFVKCNFSNLFIRLKQYR